MADTLKKPVVSPEEGPSVHALEMEALLTVLERRGIIQRADVLEEIKRLKKKTGKRVSLRGLVVEAKEGGREKPAKGEPSGRTNAAAQDRARAGAIAVAEEPKESLKGKPPVDWMAAVETDQEPRYTPPAKVVPAAEPQEHPQDKPPAPPVAVAEPKANPPLSAAKGGRVVEAPLRVASAPMTVLSTPTKREEGAGAHEQVTFEVGKDAWPSGHLDSLYELSCLQCPAWRMTVRGQRAAESQVEEHRGALGHRIRVTCTAPSRSGER